MLLQKNMTLFLKADFCIVNEISLNVKTENDKNFLLDPLNVERNEMCRIDQEIHQV